MSICPCYWFDLNEDGQGKCHCGHALDEHDPVRGCTVELEDE